MPIVEKKRLSGIAEEAALGAVCVATTFKDELTKKGCNNKFSKCITHNLWDQLDQHINNFFERVKLQDLVKKNQN